jgi:hypothetical protein
MRAEEVIQHRTVKRKSPLVLEVTQGKTSVAEANRRMR